MQTSTISTNIIR